MDNKGWNFDNSYVRLPDFFYSDVKPDSVKEPELIIFNEPLAVSLGLDAARLESDEGAAVFAGNEVPEGAEPIAQAYAGHQFGHFTMLGDGRAILLGEQITPGGKRFDIVLKGAGRTPYSRGGDGRAALGPMLRECIISEAMYALGIPTTRSLAVAATGEAVARETYLEGAVLTRVADSHLRVGTFEYAARFGTVEELRALADYAIERHYPACAEEENRYLAFLQGVIGRQADLIAKWQLVGFIHGVMNTDNMTISGETIDYGPCAFMDVYDPATVFSSIDQQGRYAYGNQPYMALWNLTRFAEALLPLLSGEQEEAVKLAEDALAQFAKQFQSKWLDGMRAKLGIFGEKDGDEGLIQDLLKLMEKDQADYTNTFRALALGEWEQTGLNGQEDGALWHRRWEERLEGQMESKEDSLALMKKSSPAVIPRNHRVEAALDSAIEGDHSVLEKLLAVLEEPYAYSAEQEEYSTLPEPPDEPYRTFCGT
ncbi:protein adenylyltransferase SelO [Bacillus testis]|uniref:protein adenylyltransferase SelO n=1 Tax=Bacillus testis TaxID=1622072 RepID=UPI00067EF6C2|nr:YdiU family protein [Bacillus testis]